MLKRGPFARRHRPGPALRAGAPPRAMGGAELAELKARLRHQAFHDPLTELANRALFGLRLDEAIRDARATLAPVAVLLLDLDRFREINDALGHAAGDEVLRALAPRLRSVLRDDDTIARFGGDEFAVLLPGADGTGAALAARRILRVLERPIEIAGRSLGVGGSVGVALFPEHGLDADTLLRRADAAMYFAKHSGAGHSFYDADRDESSPDRLALVTDLRAALDGDGIVLHYQPIVDVQTRTLVGFEALARMRHPTKGIVPPDQFIPLAERTGLIKPLTIRVLRDALRQCRTWHDVGLRTGIAVNVSARMLQDQSLPEIVAATLAAAGLLPPILTLEITESAIMADPPRATEILARLSRMGVRLTIDDFGTGYSSLIHLKRLPVDEIKIDKSFVVDIATDVGDAAISRSTIDLGHNLGLKVVAEGVESAEALAMLAGYGCDVAQGYFLGRPMPPDAVLAWLRETPSIKVADLEPAVEDALAQLRRRAGTGATPDLRIAPRV